VRLQDGGTTIKITKHVQQGIRFFQSFLDLRLHPPF